MHRKAIIVTVGFGTQGEEIYGVRLESVSRTLQKHSP